VINYVALLALLVVYKYSRGRINLALVIIAYYAAYMLMEFYPPGVSEQAGWAAFYLRQSALDLLFVIICCVLSLKYQRFMYFLGYAFIIGTTQATQVLMLADPVAFRSLHEWRQAVAVPIDLMFGVLGSANSVSDYFANRFRAAYNHSTTTGRNRSDIDA
jgi:hypothetical protein